MYLFCSISGSELGKSAQKMTTGKVDAKVVLLGKSYVGKTCLVERYLKDRFLGDAVPYQNVSVSDLTGVT